MMQKTFSSSNVVAQLSEQKIKATDVREEGFANGMDDCASEEGVRRKKKRLDKETQPDLMMELNSCVIVGDCRKVAATDAMLLTSGVDLGADSFEVKDRKGVGFSGMESGLQGGEEAGQRKIGRRQGKRDRKVHTAEEHNGTNLHAYDLTRLVWRWHHTGR